MMCFDPCRLVLLGPAERAKVWQYLSRDTFAEMMEADYFPDRIRPRDWLLGSTQHGRLFQGHVVWLDGHTYFNAGVSFIADQ